MSRRHDDSEGSLDLLLDTICNTFGGVLFISILVVVMLNFSSADVVATYPGDAAQTQLIQWAQRLEETNQELSKLAVALEEQQKIGRHIDDPNLRDMVRQLTESHENSAELLRNKKDGLGNISQTQMETNNTAKDMQITQHSLQEARRQVQELERQFQQEIASRTRAAKLPRTRPATKPTEIALFLRAGRLCTYLKLGPNRQLIENDAEIVAKKDEQNRDYIEPKAGAGIVVDPTGGDFRGIDQRLSEFESDKHYLRIFVWPDSFQHFAVVKDRVVSKQFEYCLEPFPAEQKIFVGLQQDQNVQDVQ